MIRVLQICNKPPLPKVDGGCVAINNISEGLINNPEVDLKILTVETEKHPFIKEDYPLSYIKKANIESVFIDTRVNFVDAFSSYITSDSYNVIRFFSPSFDKRIREILEQETFDIIHIESLFVTPYIHTIRRYSDAKIVMRSHNIEHKLWQDKSRTTRNPFKKIYLSFLYKKLKQYEINILSNVDAIACISESDKIYLQRLTKIPMDTIPLGVDINDKPKHNKKGVLKLFHIGAMDWEPNVNAIDWFLEEVWPSLIKRFPDIELHLAGKNISKDYHLPHINVICHGMVEDAKKFIQKHDVLIIPLKTASGLRIKIIEAMSEGKIVFSSIVGIRGIRAEDKKQFLLTNSLEDYIDAIEFLNNEKEKVEVIRQNAFDLVKKDFDKRSVIHRLVQFYKSIL